MKTPKGGFADAWVAATVKFYHATLVHKDSEFAQLETAITLLSLPYK